ncbi:hypothetical protein ACFE04_028615 [Oxalis oulophora]
MLCDPSRSYQIQIPTILTVVGLRVIDGDGAIVYAAPIPLTATEEQSCPSLALYPAVQQPPCPALCPAVTVTLITPAISISIAARPSNPRPSYRRDRSLVGDRFPTTQFFILFPTPSSSLACILFPNT